MCPNERKQRQTSFFYAINMLWRYWHHVAIQPNHWRHLHFRWRWLLLFDVYLYDRCVCKQESLLENIKLCEIFNFSLYLWLHCCCHTQNTELRDLLSKGPKYREPVSYSWHQNIGIIMDACEEYARRWAKKEDVEVDTLSEWSKSITDF